MFFKRFVTGLAVTALFAPQLSLAATSQQLLDRAFEMSVAQRQPMATTVDFTFTYNYRPVARGEHGGGVKVHVVATNEVLPRTSLLVADQEQRIRVESVDLMGAQVLGLGASAVWKDPVSFEMKKIGTVYYVRVASVSDEARALIRQAEIPLDLDNVVGRWLQIDPDRLQQSLENALPVGGTSLEFSTQAQEDLMRQLLPVIEKPGLLRVVRVESRTKRDGAMYSRVQFQLNPRLWTELETIFRKQIEKDLASLKTQNRKAYNTQYAAQLKDLRTTLNMIRAKLAKVRMVAVVSEGTGRVERIEAGGKFVEPSYSETYVGRRLVKKLVGYNEIGFTLISAIKSVPDRQLVVPTTFVTLESLIELFKQQMSANFVTPSVEGGS